MEPRLENCPTKHSRTHSRYFICSFILWLLRATLFFKFAINVTDYYGFYKKKKKKIVSRNTGGNFDHQ